MRIVADQHIPYIKDYFGHCDLILKDGRQIKPSDVKLADILLVRSITQVDANLLSGSSVKWVGSVTAGADHIDQNWLASQGIACLLASGFNAAPVADYVVSVIAALQQQGKLMTHSLRAAVIGVGQVGTRVVKHLKALGIEIIFCDPIRALKEPDFLSVSLENILDVDIISLHVPLNFADAYPTYHFLGEDFFSRQKSNAVLINASRGGVIDTLALKNAGKHLQWCLDVYEKEPAIDAEILSHAVLASPHIAGYSVQSKIRGIALIYHQLLATKAFLPQLNSSLAFPRQRLHFADIPLNWQAIVLGVFNPGIMTTVMRTYLAQHGEQGFDELRQHFQPRYEFEFVDIPHNNIPEEDQNILKRLGFHLV